MEDSLLGASNICWENLNSNLEGFYHTLIKTTYGDKPTKKHTGECWQIVKLMVEVFLRDTRKSIVGEDTAYVASDPHMRMDQYFLHTIQSHIVMTEFR